MHEYGGGMYVAFRGEDGGESVIFSDQADQRLYRQDLRPAGEGRTRRAAGRRSRSGHLDRPAAHHARLRRPRAPTATPTGASRRTAACS